MKLLTVGYGNRGMGPFLDLLGRFQVTHLVDVRTTPYSRYHVDFGREALAETVRKAGFKYVYMGDTLGGEAARANLEHYHTGLNVLYRKLHNEPKKVLCLMCGCLRSQNCHRGLIVAEDLVEMGVDVFHIDESDAAIDHADLRKLCPPKQLALL